MLGEREGSSLPAATTSLCSCKLQEQNVVLFLGQLKHEIIREAFDVAANSQVEVTGGDLVEFGQLRIEHDLLATDQVDPAFDQFHWYREPFDDGGRRFPGHFGLPPCSKGLEKFH